MLSDKESSWAAKAKLYQIKYFHSGQPLKFDEDISNYFLSHLDLTGIAIEEVHDHIDNFVAQTGYKPADINAYQDFPNSQSFPRGNISRYLEKSFLAYYFKPSSKDLNEILPNLIREFEVT